MSFIWIDALWFLFLIPLIIVTYVLIQQQRQKYALRYASLSLVKEALGRRPSRRRHISAILFIIAVTIIIFAVARPTATVILPSKQGTVVLSIDVSGSMNAEDIKPNRMDAAKAAARVFVEKQPSNVSIGVVSFSDAAAIVQAPTKDRELINAAINRLTTQRSTAIGRGILISLDAIFEKPGGQPAPISREVLSPSNDAEPPTTEPIPSGTYAPAIIVLLSDGQSNSGPMPLDIIEQASKRGIRVYTIGIGSPEGAVLKVEGRSVRVRLDEDTLKQIADQTDAKYFKADNETDLRNIYENLSTQVVFNPEQTELTAWFTGAATALLLISGILALMWYHRLP